MLTQSPFSWSGEHSGLTCGASSSGGWSCRSHSGIRLSCKTWGRRTRCVRFCPVKEWSSCTTSRSPQMLSAAEERAPSGGGCVVGALLPCDVLNLCWKSRNSSWEKRVNNRVATLPVRRWVLSSLEFCSLRCGSRRLESISQESFLHIISYYLKFSFYIFFFLRSQNGFVMHDLCLVIHFLDQNCVVSGSSKNCRALWCNSFRNAEDSFMQ